MVFTSECTCIGICLIEMHIKNTWGKRMNVRGWMSPFSQEPPVTAWWKSPFLLLAMILCKRDFHVLPVYIGCCSSHFGTSTELGAEQFETGLLNLEKPKKNKFFWLPVESETKVLFRDWQDYKISIGSHLQVGFSVFQTCKNNWRSLLNNVAFIIKHLLVIMSTLITSFIALVSYQNCNQYF